MAETSADVTSLTEAQLRLIEMQLRLRQIQNMSELNEEAQKEKKLLDSQIKEQADIIQNIKDQIKVGKRSMISIEKESTVREEMIKEYNRGIGFIKGLNESTKETRKKIDDWRKQWKGTGIDDVLYDTSVTLKSIFGKGGLFQAGKFGAIGEKVWSAGGWGQVASNSLKTLAGTSSALAGVFTGLFLAGKAYYDKVLLHSIQMYNQMGQMLGLGYEKRNLMQGGWGLSDLMTRLYYSQTSEQWTANKLAAASIIRRQSPTEIDALTKSLAANAEKWGVATDMMSPTMRAMSLQFKRMFNITDLDHIGSVFNSLMENVEGTGFTMQEFAQIMANNAMSLNMFDVSITDFAQNLRKYGGWMQQGILTMQDLQTGGWQKEATGNLAFMAQAALKSGIISEKTLGAGLDSGVFAQAGAMREYLGKKIKAGEIKEVVDILRSIPGVQKLMETTGALNNKYAFKELLTKLGLPLTSELAAFGEGKSAEKFWTAGTVGETAMTVQGVPDFSTELKSTSQIAAENLRYNLLTSPRKWLTVLAMVVGSFQRASNEMAKALQSLGGAEVNKIADTSGGANANT